MLKKILLWIIAAIITIAAAVFQRLTGPTYPLRGNINLNEQTISFKLVRSIEIGSNASIKIPYVENTDAFIAYKRYKTDDTLTVVRMQKKDNEYFVVLPDLPPAGKYAYSAYYQIDGEKHYLNKSDVIVRYKGAVPSWVLFFHVLFMFMAMVISNYTGLLSVFNKAFVHRWAIVTIVFLFIGGLVFGPIVQKYAFNEYWAGFPFGYDLTDNKVLLSFIVWIIALTAYLRTNNSKWYLMASIVMLIIYLIPHSLYGSELDFSTGEIKQG